MKRRPILQKSTHEGGGNNRQRKKNRVLHRKEKDSLFLKIRWRAFRSEKGAPLLSKGQKMPRRKKPAEGRAANCRFLGGRGFPVTGRGSFSSLGKRVRNKKTRRQPIDFRPRVNTGGSKKNAWGLPWEKGRRRVRTKKKGGTSGEEEVPPTKTVAFLVRVQGGRGRTGGGGGGGGGKKKPGFERGKEQVVVAKQPAPSNPEREGTSPSLLEKGLTAQRAAVPKKVYV